MLLNCKKLREPNFWEGINSFSFISMSNFSSFNNLFAVITRLSDLGLSQRRFTLLIKMKDVISKSNGSSKSTWKPWRWMRHDLIFMVRDVYINSNNNPVTKLISISRSIQLKDILQCNISKSKMTTKSIPISTRTIKCSVMKSSIPLSLKEIQCKLRRIPKRHVPKFSKEGRFWQKT